MNSRIVLGYHGCDESFGEELLSGAKAIAEWKPSVNVFDWLGRGIYFWEDSPERAWEWARERIAARGGKPSVVGASIQLGRCFDLLNRANTAVLAKTYRELEEMYRVKGLSLPVPRKESSKRRELDCLVINDCLLRLEAKGILYDTVRGGFLEGPPAYPGAGFSMDGHVQIAVRNPSCILDVFRPNSE